MSTHTVSPHWDIFCAVVDNYGDIGVTWRLARQLAKEYQLDIRLWVDDLHSFAHILPQLNPALTEQCFAGVTILPWREPLPKAWQPGAVLIEAFACELPNSVKHTLQQRKQQNGALPCWLNLEYLCAETWVDGCHGLPSMQASGIDKYFFFPGFTPKTGGLICEKNLFAERDRWQADISNRRALFQQLGLTGIADDDRVISVFSYETPALPALCQQWQQTDRPVHVLLPKGRSLNSLTDWLPCPPETVKPGQTFTQGNVSLHILPMTDQEGYDRLLWSCDMNIVRGEDSFLRAQWAAKPFIWHIYPQDEDYHLIKLQAFMALYCHNLAPEIGRYWQALNMAFNQGHPVEVALNWQQLEKTTTALQQHAKQWPIDAINPADLASRLVQFVRK